MNPSKGRTSSLVRPYLIVKPTSFYKYMQLN